MKSLIFFAVAFVAVVGVNSSRELTSDEILSGFKLPLQETSHRPIDAILDSAASKADAGVDELDIKSTRHWSGAGVFDEKWRWSKKVIPFKFSSDYDGVDVSMVYSSMKEWMEKTCLRFEPFDDSIAEKLGHRNFIEFHSDNGCYSMVGMQGNGAQWVSLAIPSCMYHQVSLHELGHAIGLHHEQCRLDRDKYLNIRWWNVWPHQKFNFGRMLDTSNYSISYDYCSIMHYGAWAFGMGTGFTIMPKDVSYIFTMGKSMHLTFSDEKIVNVMYKCEEECKDEKVKARCHAPCFVNRQCECRCPDNKCADRRSKCEDEHPTCPKWAKMGECDRNPGYMLGNCPESCGICDQLLGQIDKEQPKERCNDYNDKCVEWTGWGECEKNPNYMLAACTRSCGLCDGPCEDVYKAEPGAESCESWAKADECEINPTWMLKNCKKTCKLC